MRKRENPQPVRVTLGVITLSLGGLRRGGNKLTRKGRENVSGR